MPFQSSSKKRIVSRIPQLNHDHIFLQVPQIDVDEENNYRAKYPLPPSLQDQITSRNHIIDPRTVIENAIRLRRGQKSWNPIHNHHRSGSEEEVYGNCGVCKIVLEYELDVPLSLVKPASPEFRQTFYENDRLCKKTVIEELQIFWDAES